MPDVDTDNKLYREGFNAAITQIVAVLQQDRRGDLAKSCNYVPAWQKERWRLAELFWDQRF